MRTRAILIGMLAIAMAMFASATASATRTATISPSGAVRGTGNNLTLSNSIVSVFCDLNMDANIVASVALNLAPGGLTRLGTVTAGGATSCDGADGVNFLNLPWDLAAELPLPTGAGEIANLVILNAQIEVLVDLRNDVRCLYQGDLRATLVDTNSNGLGDTLTFDDARNQIPLAGGTSILCDLGGDGALEGNLAVTPELRVVLS